MYLNEIGPTHMDQKLVHLKSSDGRTFYIPEVIAEQSKTLATFLDRKNPFIEAYTKQIRLPMSGKVLKRAIEYMKYKFKYKNMVRSAPEFVIRDEEALDLLDVSSYLKL